MRRWRANWRPRPCVRFHAMRRSTFNRTIFACLHTLGREFPCQWRILLYRTVSTDSNRICDCFCRWTESVCVPIRQWRNSMRRTSGEFRSWEYHITIRKTADTRWSAPAPIPPVSWTSPAVSSAVVASTPAAASRLNIYTYMGAYHKSITQQVQHLGHYGCSVCTHWACVQMD